MNALKLINFNGTIVLPLIYNPLKLNVEFESLSRNNKHNITALDGKIIPWEIILDWLAIFESTWNCHPTDDMYNEMFKKYGLYLIQNDLVLSYVAIFQPWWKKKENKNISRQNIMWGKPITALAFR